MFSIFSTFLFYGSLWCICVLLASNYERTRKKMFKFLPYLIIFLISVLRFDIGSDYGPLFFTIRESISFKNGLALDGFLGPSGRSSPGLTLITLLFYYFPNPPFFVINFYFVIFLLFFYKFIDKFDSHKWGVFLLFGTTLLFQSWDWIRQGAAVAVCAYTYTLIEAKKERKIVLLVFFATVLHLSALASIPAYLLRNKIVINNKVLSLVLLLILIIAIAGVFKPLYEKVILLTPFYGDGYSRSADYATREEFLYFAPSYLFFSIWYIVILFFSNKHLNFWNILLFIGAGLFIMSGNSLVIDRVALYYTISLFVLFPNIMKCKKKSNVRHLMMIFILFNIVLIGHRFLKEGDMRGCVPYESVFSREFEHDIFRDF